MESVLQKDLNLGKSIINLPKGEFKESVIIENPCTIVGNDTILWNDTLPILSIRSRGVTIKNLKLELTNISGYDTESIVLQLQPDTIVENVEIYGSIEGAKRYYIPRSLHLGEFKANTENTFNFTIYLPEPCDIRVKSSNFKVYTADLGNGYMDLKIVTNTLTDGSMLYGEIMFTSKFIRKIFIDGIALDNAQHIVNKLLYSYDNPSQELEKEVFMISTRNTTVSNKSNINYSVEDDDIQQIFQTININRGERVTLEYVTLSMKLLYNMVSYTNTLDIDPYIFLTDANNKTIYSNDMIFFGNPCLRNESICIDEDNTIHLQLDRVPNYVKKIVVCYSIYRDTPNSFKTFAMVKDVKFSIFSGDLNIINIDVNNLKRFSNVILVEFYRHNNTWKINPCVNGYTGNLPQLCQYFGIDADY